MSLNSIRKDWKLIESFIKPKSKVLDIGCGEGGLIKQLEKNINVETRGLEIDPELTRIGISEGLNVIQGNAETDLNQYPLVPDKLVRLPTQPRPGTLLAAIPSVVLGLWAIFVMVFLNFTNL